MIPINPKDVRQHVIRDIDYLADQLRILALQENLWVKI